MRPESRATNDKSSDHHKGLILEQSSHDKLPSLGNDSADDRTDRAQVLAEIAQSKRKEILQNSNSIFGRLRIGKTLNKFPAASAKHGLARDELPRQFGSGNR